jgi:hypothetical protein
VSKNLHEGLRERGVDADFLGFLPESYKEDIEVDGHIYLCRTNIDMFSTQFSAGFVKRWRRVKDEYDVVLVSMPHPFANIVLELFPLLFRSKRFAMASRLFQQIFPVQA